MRLHGRLADEELLPDLRVRQAERDEAEDVALARAQVVELLRRREAWNPRELTDHPLRDRGGEERVARRNRPHRRDQLLRRVVLQDEAARTGPERLVDVLVQIERREDEDARLRVGREDAAGRLQPVELRHADVHQHDRRIEAGSLVDRLEAVRRLGDDLDVVLVGEQHAEAGPHHRLVVGDEDADRHRPSPPSGSLASRTKPPSGAAPAVIVPP